MKVAFDVDGVFTDLEKFQLNYGKKFFKNVKNIDDTGYDICDIFHCSREEREKFWTKYIWKYSLAEPIRKDAKLVIDKLKEDENEIYIITGRAHTTEDNAIGSLFRKIIEYWLRKNGIKYDGIYYCAEDNNSDEKFMICQKLGIDVMVEDKKENIDKIGEIADVICMNAKYNRDMNRENVFRVDDFSQIYNFLCNKKDKIDENIKRFSKDEFKTSYGIVRAIGTPIFKFLLKPTIINKEFIPNDGPLLLCGNHLHVWDQFPVICSTKRTTHWMSKKEYFDGKMGPFFRKTGAISVDRFGNPHESVNEALNYLAIGSAVGLFPEGTRNHLKMSKIKELYDEVNCGLSEEEFSQILIEQQPLLSQINILRQLYLDGEISQKEYMDAIINVDSYLKNNFSENFYYDSLLLPFKFGAVSMAQKSNATIVPFAVTGDYKIGNDNLVVNYGEGFKISDRSLEEANTELRKNVLALLKQNKKM